MHYTTDSSRSSCSVCQGPCGWGPSSGADSATGDVDRRDPLLLLRLVFDFFVRRSCTSPPASKSVSVVLGSMSVDAERGFTDRGVGDAPGGGADPVAVLDRGALVPFLEDPWGLI